VSGSDYVAVSETVTVPAGNNTIDVSVPILGDLTREHREVFTISVAPEPNLVMVDGDATATIKDDDRPLVQFV
jgi:hypothetical protein